MLLSNVTLHMGIVLKMAIAAYPAWYWQNMRVPMFASMALATLLMNQLPQYVLEIAL